MVRSGRRREDSSSGQSSIHYMGREKGEGTVGACWRLTGHQAPISLQRTEHQRAPGGGQLQFRDQGKQRKQWASVTHSPGEG